MIPVFLCQIARPYASSEINDFNKPGCRFKWYPGFIFCVNLIERAEVYGEILDGGQFVLLTGHEEFYKRIIPVKFQKTEEIKHPVQD